MLTSVFFSSFRSIEIQSFSVMLVNNDIPVVLLCETQAWPRFHALFISNLSKYCTNCRSLIFPFPTAVFNCMLLQKQHIVVGHWIYVWL